VGDEQRLPGRPPPAARGLEQQLPALRPQPEHRPPLRPRRRAADRPPDDLPRRQPSVAPHPAGRTGAVTGDAVSDRGPCRPPEEVGGSGVDPIRFEVVRNALVAATEEMAIALRRSAYSTNIKTRSDFSCAFF